MLNAFLLRRKNLGKTSCEAISKFSKTGIISVRNDEYIPEDKNLCIRWGTTSNVPQRNVLNTAKAIHLVNAKSNFRKILNENGLCPNTFLNTLEAVEADIWPLIVRPKVHHQGRHLYVVINEQELENAIREFGEGWYASPFIAKIAEYRVFIAQGRAIAVAKKIPADANAIAWNVAQGGRFENVRWNDWPLKQVKDSISAFNLSGLDFGGVDIMVDRENNSYVLEINSAPSLTSEYRQQCFAKVFDWICNKESKEHIPLIKERGGYRKFIHPAIYEGALV